MKKLSMAIATLIAIGTSAAQAAPEIWWADRVDCNIFMGHTGVVIKKDWTDYKNPKYVGSGFKNYREFKLTTCTNDDNTISCQGETSMQEPVTFTVSRKADGTFGGTLSLANEPLACLLTR